MLIKDILDRVYFGEKIMLSNNDLDIIYEGVVNENVFENLEIFLGLEVRGIRCDNDTIIIEFE